MAKVNIQSSLLAPQIESTFVKAINETGFNQPIRQQFPSLENDEIEFHMSESSYKHLMAIARGSSPIRLVLVICE